MTLKLGTVLSQHIITSTLLCLYTFIFVKDLCPMWSRLCHQLDQLLSTRTQTLKDQLLITVIAAWEFKKCHACTCLNRFSKIYKMIIFQLLTHLQRKCFWWWHFQAGNSPKYSTDTRFCYHKINKPSQRELLSQKITSTGKKRLAIAVIQGHSCNLDPVSVAPLLATQIL